MLFATSDVLTGPLPGPRQAREARQHRPLSSALLLLLLQSQKLYLCELLSFAWLTR